MDLTPQKLGLVKDDLWLEPYEPYIQDRFVRYLKTLYSIEDRWGSLEQFAQAYYDLGVNYDSRMQGWWYREWAPSAEALYLTGDFNNWERKTHPLTKREDGVWEIFLPDESYSASFVHGSFFKVHIKAANGEMDRIPAYAKAVYQDPETYDFKARVWKPAQPFEWTDDNFQPNFLKNPIIYEAHTGMAQEKEGIGTYREFADRILPRIHAQGYTCIQLMAVQEHPYYGSFGYHVSNFFTPSSRFGTPEDLKYLINKAHTMGIGVIMDIVHSHVVKNFAEGLNQFDGSDNQYFHPGGRGYHTSWDSKLFNYGKTEVLQFLLSNVAYWLQEFHFDGFRFDGVTSMMYMHHGDFMTFDHYDKYFKDGVEWDALIYLQLANELTHKLRPHAITIAEDMSGMPGLCRKIIEGGIGFDFRLAMGIPDYWIKMLKHKKDEEWDIHEMWHTITNRRYKEGTIAYAESHDQALVGDKTLAFWLMDQEMYWHMNVDDPSLVIDRGISLHKMLRLFTGVLGGEGYLNFIGNEFGHPEWVDFPREGNNWSYKYARRQWSLVDNPNLKYKFLNEFDKAMVHLIKEYQILSALAAKQVNMDAENKVIIAERNNLILVFNFHPSRSIPDYRFWVPNPGSYRIALNTDDARFGGHDRIDQNLIYSTSENDKLSIYLTNRTGLVLVRADKVN